MKRYQITAKAGPMVAGRNNTGVGTILTLAEKEAKYEVELGTLIDMEAAAKKTSKPKRAKKDAETATEGD